MLRLARLSCCYIHKWREGTKKLTELFSQYLGDGAWSAYAFNCRISVKMEISQ